MIYKLVEHYIQRDILRTLSRSGVLPFSQLRPDRLDNGIFSYHLKQLLQGGYITKTNGIYELSVEGMRYVAWAGRTNIDIHPQPKQFCFLIIENDKGEYIMHRRNGEPFVGKYTFPGGVLFFGESTDELTTRQLREKIGFDVSLTNRGLANLQLGNNGHVLSHTYAHLLHSRITGNPTPIAKDGRFAVEWVKPSDLHDDELLPDVRAILDKLASSPEYFYLELRFV